jgi:hypothetical protein
MPGAPLIVLVLAADKERRVIACETGTVLETNCVQAVGEVMLSVLSLLVSYIYYVPHR